MKKITLLLLFILSFTLFATSCGSTTGNIDSSSSSSANDNIDSSSSGSTNTVLTPPTGTYKVTVEDPQNFVITMPKCNYYAPGEKVTLYTDVLTDVDLEMYVNGIFACTQTSVRENDRYIWKYSFTMPNEAVTVTFKTRSIELFSTIYPWIDLINADDITCIFSKSCHGSIAPTLTVFDSIYKTSDKQDIAAAYDSLKNSWVYKTQEPQIDGKGPDILSLTLNQTTYTLSSLDGVFNVNGEYYKLYNQNFYTCNEFYGYAFISTVQYMSWEFFKGDEKIEDETTLQTCKNFLTQAIFTEYLCDTGHLSILTEYENSVTQDFPTCIMKADEDQEISLYSNGVFKITASNNFYRYFKIINEIELP